MNELISMLSDVFLDSLIDSIKVLPFLFLTYLLMELLEHHAEDKTEEMIKKAGKTGPIWGAVLGVLPQCGFSAAASGFYLIGNHGFWDVIYRRDTRVQKSLKD